MTEEMRVMTQRPRNAETPTDRLRSWITANDVFFDRNQGQIPAEPVALGDYRLALDGEVRRPLLLDFGQILALPRTIVANTMECSGNGRSLLVKKAIGNPWTVGGVGNAVWTGVLLSELLENAGLSGRAAHVAFEGMDQPLGKSGTRFVRSIPIEKAMSSTLLAYEMNGEPVPLKHGFPLRALALGWTGANCVKWLNRITVLEKPQAGFFMDRVYRVFQKGQDPAEGEVVTGLSLKSFITRPLAGERLDAGRITVLGTAYAGERRVAAVEVSTDGGDTWQAAGFTGPDEPWAWRQWQAVWDVQRPGRYTLMSRATDDRGSRQPENAAWNVQGYGNNGVREHAVTVTVE